MGEQLTIILGNDNEARKVAEENIKKARESEPDKYVFYLSTLINDATVEMQIRSLSAVILRRTLMSTIESTKQGLWDSLKPDTKVGLKSAFFETLKTQENKDFVHKLGNLLVEI